MIRVSDETTIERPAAEVFDFLANFENAPRWQQGVIRSRLITEGPIRLGSRFEEDVKVAFWKMLTTCEIVGYEPGRRLAFQTTSSGPISYKGEFGFTPTGSGATKLSASGEARLKGLWRLVEPFLASDVRKETRAELAAVKRALETPAPEAGTARVTGG